MLDISPEPECTSGQPGTPFSLVQVSLTKQECIDLKWQVNHYRDLWERARDRERELTAAIALMKKEHKAEVEQLKAQNKERNSQLSHMKHMVFGRSTEKKSRSKQGQEKQSKNTTRQPTTRKRGQQPGTPSHGRRKHENLPVVDQDVDLPDDEKHCPTCRLPFHPFPGCDHCDVIEFRSTDNLIRISSVGFIWPQERLPLASGRLYYLNVQRLLVRNDPQQWPTRQLRLEKQVELIASQRDKELTRPRLAPKARKVLESLANHWEAVADRLS
ncbi:hypothetical protein [Salinisphaera sp. G21_0]|uniref:hypothetical protein n=1 Tax=Salinisphaera sp. G21_0 TaxID=2821094 RepID=UPI001ADA64F6|nr:hypothetical protein [Salinisphaera sp. G21_0]MBO9484459.1 hypothetical protein [Salinisphaera sp. G21_0]